MQFSFNYKMLEATGGNNLISVINDLQNVFASNFHSMGLELPQIAVVGGQSAGKSSVLENFVGKDFLPRGQGIVTRRPLIIQMHHNSDSEWAEFLHTKSKKFYDFSAVRQEIQEETDREVGKNKAISRKPIHLRIYSPHVLDLTLVDLPGLTKVPTGDQPEDIENQIRNMINEYIQQQNTIILAVTPANQDLANSDALKLARDVDPSGQRTIGVITKLDLMDEGTNALDIFEGKLCPLRKGYIGIVNRSQKEINGNKRINDALKKEEEFFQNGAYKSLSHKMGSKYLQGYLSKELMSHIRNLLPDLLLSLEEKLEQLSDELSSLGLGEFGSKSKITILHRLVAQFSRDVVASLDGNTRDVSVSSTNAGYEINKTLYGEVQDLLCKVDTKPVDDVISYALANLSGYNTNIFPHQLAFDISVKKIVENYKKPVIDGVDIIKGIMLSCVEECADSRLKSYPKLHNIAFSLVRQVIDGNARLATSNLNCYLDAQKAFINIRHPDFIQDISSFSNEIKLMPSGTFHQVSHNSSPLQHSQKPQETKSSFYLEPDGRRQGLKMSDMKLSKSTENLSSNKISNGWRIKKIFGSKSKMMDTVREDSLIHDQTNILTKMVQSYMKVVNTGIIDMTPKYIILNLIQGTIFYMKLQFESSIFETRETNEEKLELLEIEEGEQKRIDELLKMEEAVRHAIELVKKHI